MIRGQFCLYESAPDKHGWSPSGGVGLIEAPIGEFRTEHVLGFVGTVLGPGLLMTLADYAEHEAENHGEEISHHVTYSIWPRPVPGSGMTGGGLLLRSTRIPAAPGHEVLLASMCVHAPKGAIASQRLYSITGRAETDRAPEMLVMHDPVLCEPLARNGIGMANLLKLPVWGWGKEKFAFQSTMRLEIIDQCREIRLLQDMAVRSPQEERRLLDLRGTPGWNVVNVSRNEPEYDEFRRLVGSEHPHDDWSKPVTATQSRLRSERCDQIVKEIMGGRWKMRA